MTGTGSSRPVLGRQLARICLLSNRHCAACVPFDFSSDEGFEGHYLFGAAAVHVDDLAVLGAHRQVLRPHLRLESGGHVVHEHRHDNVQILVAVEVRIADVAEAAHLVPCVLL